MLGLQAPCFWDPVMPVGLPGEDQLFLTGHERDLNIMTTKVAAILAALEFQA